ncbi:MAG: hypothetical protein ACFFH0_05755, partial [Promethearchaeota archaeon]
MYLFSRIASQAPEVLITLLVFSLSSGVLGGVLFYLDSAGPDVMDEMSAETLVDMEVYLHPSFYNQTEFTILDFMELMAEQESVGTLEHVSILQAYDANASVSDLRRTTALGIGSTFLETYSDLVDLGSDNLQLNESGCYVERTVFLEQGMQIGGNYTVSIPVENGGAQERLNHTFTILGTFETDLTSNHGLYNQQAFSNLLLMTSRESLWVNFSQLEHEGENSIHDRIWVGFDKNSLVSGDPTASVSALKAIENRVEQRMLPYASVVKFELVDVMNEYSAWIASMRVIALAFTIPSLVMGVMLVQYNSNLLSDERRRNVGALKTRGSSDSQAFFWVLGMVLFAGIVGSVGAILTGAFLALLSGSIRELMVFDLTQLGSYELVLGLQSIAGLVLFAFGVGVAVGVPTAVRALLMTPAEAHSVLEREALTQEEKMSSPLIPGGIVGISLVLLIPLLSFLSSSSLSVLGSLLFATTIIALLAGFVVSLTLLLSRLGASLKSSILTRIQGQRLKVGLQLIGRSARVFRRSETYSLMFIAMVFTAGIFSSWAATTGNSHMKALFQYEVGADIVIDVMPGLDNVTPELVDEIENIEGVSCATGILKIGATAEFWNDWGGNVWPFRRSATIYGVNGSEFLSSAFVMPYFTYYQHPAESFRLLDENYTCIMSSFRPVIGYETVNFGERAPIFSDQMILEFYTPSGKQRSNHTIVDVMADHPAGFVPQVYGRSPFQKATYFPGEEHIDIFFVVNLDYVHSVINHTLVNKIYVDLEPTADYNRIMSEIVDLAPRSFSSVESPLPSIDAVLDTRAGQTVYGAYSLNIMFSVLYLTAGTTLVMTAKIRKMRKSFSILRALGSESESIT